MAEVLLSPGVLARENDNTFISAQPVQAGAAILGPTVKGPVGIPTLVSSFSDYKTSHHIFRPRMVLMLQVHDMLLLDLTTPLHPKQ